MSVHRTSRLVMALLAGSLLVGGCSAGGEPGSGGLPVTTQVVSDATTQDIRVFAPDSEGRWPVVLALHGIGGSSQDVAELATRLAGTGAVVFAPTYRSDLSTADGFTQATTDIVCAYRYALAKAAEHGGDLDQPLTVVGWSLGASFSLLGGLSSTPEPAADDPCPGDGTLPEVVVGISGCYYEYQGQPNSWFDDVSAMGNKDAHVSLVAGEQDSTCPAVQSEKLAGALRGVGYDVDLTELAGADHLAPVFHEERDGQLHPASDDAPGRQTVQVIADAIAAAQS